LPDDLSFELDAKALDEKGYARILFQPDGSLGENSPEKVRIRNTVQDETIEIAKTDPIMGYAIGDESRTRWVSSEER